MSQVKFVQHINAQPLPVETHPPYRHIDPLSQSTVSRILTGNFIPDPDTLFRIARYGFGLNLRECGLLEDIRYEAYLLAKEEKRTTQQLAVIRVPRTEEFEVKSEVSKQERTPKIPDWVYMY